MELKEITKDLITNTREEWRRQIDTDDYFDGAEIYRYLDWVHDRVVDPSYENKDYYLYGLVDSAEPHPYAHAIVEVAHAKAGFQDSWLKVLKTRYEPKVYMAFMENDQDHLMEIMATCFAESIQLIEKHKTTTIKLLSENDFIATLYKGMAVNLKDLPQRGIHVKYYRKWLEFNVQ